MLPSVYRWCGGDENDPAASAAEALRVVQSSNYKQVPLQKGEQMNIKEFDCPSPRVLFFLLFLPPVTS